MKDFEDSRRVAKGVSSFAEALITGDQDQVLHLGQEQAAVVAFNNNDPQFMSMLQGAGGNQAASDVLAGFDKNASLLPPAVAEKMREELVAKLYNARTNENYDDLVVMGKKMSEWKAEEQKAADDLKKAEQSRLSALMALSESQEALKNTFRDQSEALVAGLQSTTAAIQGGIRILPEAGTGAATEAGARAAEGGAGNLDLPSDRIVNPVVVQNFRQKIYDYNKKVKEEGSSPEIDEMLKQIEEEYLRDFGAIKPSKSSTGKAANILRNLDAREQEVKEGKVKTRPSPLASPDISESNPLPVAVSNGTMPTTATQLTQGPALNPAALIASMGINTPVSSENMLQSLLSGISAANPLPVTVINVAEFNREGNTTAEGEGTRPFNMFATEEASRFLNDFTSSIAQFKTYVDNLQKIISVPIRIEMTGRHTVDVRVTGAAAFEALKGDFENLIRNEIDKKMQSIWAKSGGAFGSSGAAGRSVQPTQY